MPWPRCTFETLRALISSARVDRTLDADGEGHAQTTFDLFHASIVADVRARISDGGHVLDADSLSVPPEFTLLVGLRIAALVLSRPGATGGTEAVVNLSAEQKSLMASLEKRLDAVAQGKSVTATDNPEAAATTAPLQAASAAVVRPGIGYDRNFTGLGTT